jgi:hypothetical protein
MFLVLPIRTGFENLNDFTGITRRFWGGLWEGISVGNAILLGLNIAVIALGISGAVRRWHWAGWVPLGMCLAYALSNTVARNSGWRYMLPVDWTGYLYFSMGLVEMTHLVGVFFGVRGETPTPRIERPVGPRESWRQWGGIALAILFIGATLPISEMAFPQRYPSLSREELFEYALGSAAAEAQVSPDRIEEIAAIEGMQIARGRALYPRFYYPRQGEPGTGWAIYKEREGRRLSFKLIGQDDLGVILYIEDILQHFPNASDVVVFGCPAEDYFDAALVIVEGDPGAAYFSSKKIPESCAAFIGEP